MLGVVKKALVYYDCFTRLSKKIFKAGKYTSIGPWLAEFYSVYKPYKVHSAKNKLTQTAGKTMG